MDRFDASHECREVTCLYNSTNWWLEKMIEDPRNEVEIEPGATVAEVLGRLGVPADQARVLFVNNRAATLDHALEGGEQMGVFPALGGG